MSVQAGIWNFDGRPVDRKFLADMSESLKHQGPDGESFHVDGSIAFLYRPFHTTAESRREKQPYISRRGFVLTWDGRLDNRAELIRELRGELEANSTDVAIVAAAFDRWETDCFPRFVGDWATAIWRPEQRDLTLAIDYMAIRHIFYYFKQVQVWWATDLAPLVLLSVDKFHIDDDYIAGYLVQDPDADLTPYREIREAPPGQFVRIRDGRVVVERYWEFNSKSRVRYKTDAEYEEHFRHIFRQSVRRRLRSDSPILAELSGGLDSSSIVCMADDILAKEGAETPVLDTLSYYDKSEPHGDDWVYFPKVEEARGRVGTHINASKVGSASASIECTDFNPLPGHLGSDRQLENERADVVRNGKYRVVLSGVGGDEFTGGIPNPNAQLADLLVQMKFIELAQQLTAWSFVKRLPWIQLLGQVVLDLLPPSLGEHFIQPRKIESWVERDFVARAKRATRSSGLQEHCGISLPTLRGYITGVLSMAAKLAKWKPPVQASEERSYPYLDQNLIEFLLSIPATQLLRPGERRSLMRRSLIGVVPPEVLSRKTKQFCARTPVVAMREHLEQLQTTFQAAVSSDFGYINQVQFLRELRAAVNGRETHIERMLRTISLELWLRDLISRRLIHTTSVSPTPIASISLE